MGISSKQRKVLSAVILSSILGMGIGAHPVLAQDITNDPATVSTGSSPYFGAQAKGSDNAVSNQLSVSGDAALNSAYGGLADQGQATGNSLNISGGTVVNGYGGYSAGSDVTGNGITMTGGSVTGALYGGYTAKGAAGAEDASNTVTITKPGDNMGTLITGGASASGSASYNTVSITDANETDTDSLVIFGGNASGGAASSNGVSISGSNFANINIRGGVNLTGTGDVNGNTVSVTGSTLNESTMNSVVVIGAQNLGTGTLNGNTLTIDSSTVQYSNANGTFWGLVRAADRSSDTEGVANNNTITIQNGSTVGKVDGAYQRNGATVRPTATRQSLLTVP